MAMALVTVSMAANMLKPKRMSIPKDQTLERTAKSTLIHPLPEQLGHMKRLKLFEKPKLGVGCAILSAMVSSNDPAWAVQQVAETAEGDNRVLVLILPIIVAVSWVLYNILGPALNQIERMRSDKGIILGFGLSGLVASKIFSVAEASAVEIAMIGETPDDNQSSLRLVFIGTALTWVLYESLLKPVLNQSK